MITTQHLWNQYAADIKHFILSKVKDDVVSDDLLQETFIKAHTKLKTLKDPEKVKSWLFSIARYTVIDYFRKRDIVLETNSNEKITFDDYEMDHTEADCLRGILSHLPKKYRDPLFLSDIKGMKQTQVSEQLQLPLATVKSQIQRGRKLIAKGFMDCCDYKMNANGFLVGELKQKADCKVCK